MSPRDEKTDNARTGLPPVDQAVFAAFIDKVTEGDMPAVKSALSDTPALLTRLDSVGWISLTWAAATGQAKMAQLLIDCGAPVDHPSGNGHTPLMSAAETGDDKMAALLLAAGANSKLTDNDGRSAADYAREAGNEKLAETIASHVPPKTLTLERDLPVTHAIKIRKPAP
ncbi:MAG: hypothetical protein GC185_04500 [Alphaproteobacteria bacterium]|nr:hypothetical protein [Alphaproteobacteria bacterium]